jgi:sortase (surface protein transpeptidase)
MGGGQRGGMFVALTALLVLSVVGCGSSDEEPDPGTGQRDEHGAQEDVLPRPVTVPAVDREASPYPQGDPVRVIVPAIGVDARLVRLGLNPDRSMEVPDFGLAGWYAKGPKPGHPGPAVIAAHVNSRAGPDVFYRLRELQPGHEVRVVFDSGDEVTFVVDSREQVPKDHLPADRIWPVTNDRILTLITCGGEFDTAVRRHRDNVIVYTSPADA